jgi:hypothetical protein
MSVYCIEMYSIYRVYTVHIVYTLQVSISTSGIGIHSTWWDCQSPNPQEIQCFNGNFVFDLHDSFHKCNQGIKRDLSVYEYNRSGYHGGPAEIMFFWAFTSCNTISIFCHLDKCAASIFRLTE